MNFYQGENPPTHLQVYFDIVLPEMDTWSAINETNLFEKLRDLDTHTTTSL